jgi:hypothetical protein
MARACEGRALAEGGGVVMFHVPEQYRLTAIKARFLGVGKAMISEPGCGNYGCFYLPPYSGRRELWVICSDGMGWEHVSVHASSSRGNATPNWAEMCYVKDMFWDAEDVVMQLHPRRSEYSNTHPNTLHLWRPNDGRVIPEPEYFLVGAKAGQSVAEAEAEGRRAYHE